MASSDGDGDDSGDGDDDNDDGFVLSSIVDDAAACTPLCSCPGSTVRSGTPTPHCLKVKSTSTDDRVSSYSLSPLVYYYYLV